jgi:hypothetical protein
MPVIYSFDVDAKDFLKKYWWVIPLFALSPVLGVLVFTVVFISFLKNSGKTKKIDSMAFAKNLRRVGVSTDRVSVCPKCGSTSVYSVNGHLRCGSCGFKG